ncbi:MAG TPA: hypothetical protein VNZ03_20705 [Terriglobales bacterium]|nr:hypothetical protein [Terriglobales bacterium]
MTHYQEYKVVCDKNRAELKVPGDCTVRVPQYRAFIDLIDPPSWDFEWWLTFSDKYYVVCHEAWSCRKGKQPKRHYFSFHYGPIVRTGKNGNPDRDASNPLVLRICNSNKSGDPPHLHYKLPHPAPYYEQGRVDGLVLEDVDMFQFVKAVFRSRAEKVDMDKAMGFTLR